MNLEITRPFLKMAGLTLIPCCLAVGQQSAGPGTLPVSAIVQGMEKAQFEVRVQVPKVVAQVGFKPPTSKDYSIQKWSGSSRGKQIVQRVLDHEVEASQGNQARTALSGHS